MAYLNHVLDAIRDTLLYLFPDHILLAEVEAEAEVGVVPAPVLAGRSDPDGDLPRGSEVPAPLEVPPRASIKRKKTEDAATSERDRKRVRKDRGKSFLELLEEAVDRVSLWPLRGDSIIVMRMNVYARSKWNEY